MFAVYTGITATMHGESPPIDSFNPGANGSVYAVALQPDGKLVVGGDFTNLCSQARSRLGRLHSLEPVSNSLVFDGTHMLRWVRGTAGPEIGEAVFELVDPGLGWVNLGTPMRYTPGCEVTNVSLPPDATVRARGYTCGGVHNG